MRCSKQIRRLFTDPEHAGHLPDDGPGQGIAQVGRPGYGEVIRLELQLDEPGHYIKAARFQAAGCGFLIATAEWTCRTVTGLPIAEASALKPEAVATALSLPPAKFHCATLLCKALTEAGAKAQASLNSSP